ncbi:MAG TPA: RnfH family protein [Gammaproteobacteria bacterium]|nr:RnfH family protein [Gammaproteobacteria bacterium]
MTRNEFPAFSDRSAGPAVVEVVYALSDRQRIVTLPLEDGLTAGQAVARSGLCEEFAEITTRPLVLGLYGQPIEADYVLKADDRIEICRPLERDPRDLRREMLKHGRVMGGSAAAAKR